MGSVVIVSLTTENDIIIMMSNYLMEIWLLYVINEITWKAHGVWKYSSTKRVAFKGGNEPGLSG
ncbi:hypothetical protein DGG96_16820 [Legionella qingyii]|uniref:Uncharacterized protein n=1 Tax=Legionella qingyii TaxID=2184757 RepID=A0A317TZQ0_9GAMM|nr:hypothetical protein DGG96_16820 [Legionella qingyii]